MSQHPVTANRSINGLQAGLAAYRAGDAARARALLDQVVVDDPDQPDAWYYLGLLHYAGHDWATSLFCLNQTRRLNPTHENAMRYHAIVSAEQKRAEAQAVIDLPNAPTVAAAATPTPAPPTTEVDLSLDLPETSPYGVYRVLAASSDVLVKQPLDIIDSLRIRSRPNFSAFAYRFLLEIAVALLGGYILAQLAQTVRYVDDSHDRRYATTAGVLIIGAAILALLWTWQLMEIATTTYVLDRGRLQRTRGVTLRRQTNLELYRINDVVLVRNPIQRLTGDGTLHLHTAREVIAVTGLARGVELDLIFQRLLDLVFALRANNYVRGIIS